MSRITPLPMILACLLLAACSTDESATETAATPEAEATTAASDLPAEGAERGLDPEGLLPLSMPAAVIDTTPVDTEVTGIDSSNQASETELTGMISENFGPKDSVYLDIRTRGTAEKYTISSKWFYPDGEVITENSQVIQGAGPTSTIFSMSKPDGWAPGTYKVEISINGRLQQTKTFQVP